MTQPATTPPQADAPGRSALDKLATGIPGFDVIAEGGLPRARATLIAGSAGSAKTVFATHFLAAGITTAGDHGVFVTFEDAVEAIRTNMRSFGWDIAGWERDGAWRFVDASPPLDGPATVVGEFDLGALLARVTHAVTEVGATRVVLDSLNRLFAQYADHAMLRAELFRIVETLKRIGATVVFTGERTEEYGGITRYGLEEFVADNVVVLRNLLDGERRRRTVEILKMRGASHQRGEFPFTVRPGEGIVVLPLAGLRLTQQSSTTRVTSGVPALDRMCGGGFFRDSVVLVSGATGTGKTLLVTKFLAGGADSDERALLFAFEESRDQLVRNARAWGVDFARMEAEGRLLIVPRYPHAVSIEDHLVDMLQTIDDFRPTRIAVDSLSALERVAPRRGFREFVVTLTSTLKTREIASLFTSTTVALFGGGSVTEQHISTLTDSIILLRYVEAFGRMRRAATVLKMRGAAHDADVREYTIDGQGLHLGEPFRDVTGILAGHPVFGPGASGGGPGRARGEDQDRA